MLDGLGADNESLYYCETEVFNTSVFLFYSHFKNKIMPKIKFSALVSGMSGKANGSVFATNASGAYFRTNSSRVKPQTAVNTIRRGAFTTISQLWRTISFEQQASWNSSAINFPRLNAFGDTVIPSGYQLFMRLNSTLATANILPLLDPPSPRSLPDLGNVEIINSDLFQFMPQVFGATFQNDNLALPVTYTGQDFFPSGDFMAMKAISFRMQIVESLFKNTPFNSSVVLFTREYANSDALQMRMINYSENEVQIEIRFNSGNGAVELTTQPLQLDLSTSHVYTLSMDGAVVLDANLYIDGILTPTTPLLVNVLSPPAGSSSLILGDLASNSASRMYFSDFRIYSRILTLAEVKLISNGYVLGVESNIIPFNSISPTGQMFSEYGLRSAVLQLSSVTNTRSVLKSMSAALMPSIILSVPNEGMVNMAINIYASPPISNGRGGVISNWRMIGSLEWSTAFEVNISQMWASKFGSFPAGSNIVFKLEIFDKETGVIPSSIGKPPRRIRFKAGAEMQGHVS